MSNQRGNLLTILSAFLLALIVVIGLYYLGIQKQKTPSSTTTLESSETWKTYTSKRLKLSFIYPPQRYKVNEGNPTEVVQNYIKSEGSFVLAEIRFCPEENSNKCYINPDERAIYIEAYDNRKNLSVDDWLKNSVYAQNRFDDCIYKDPRTKISVDNSFGNRAITYQVIYDKESLNGVCKGKGIVADRKMKIIYTKGGQKIYFIEVNYESKFKNIHSEIDKILSTFKLIN